MVQTTIITVKFYFAKLLIFVLLKLFNFNKLKNCVFPQSTTSLPYSKLQVDQLPPIIDRPKKYDYKKLLQDYLQIHNKPLEPIKRRKNPSINIKLSCPFCNAPSDFIYDNNGHRGQFLCKICKSTFHKTTNPDILILLCPHCREKLYKIKDRSGFSIFKCVNKKCPLYLSNLSNLSQTQLQLYKLHPHKFKLHYLFRDFKFKLFELASNSTDKPIIDLAKVHKPLNIIGIVLTLYANYGLSSRIVSGYNELYLFG